MADAKPWEDYQSTAKTESKPWEEYAPVQPQVQVQVQPQQDNSIVRQLGLTTRIGIEGLSDMGAGVINMATKIGNQLPVGKLSHLVADQLMPGYSQQEQNSLDTVNQGGTNVADMLGLPKPQDATERVVNTTGRLLVQTGGMIKAGNIAQKSMSPTMQKIAQFLSAAPVQQIAGSAGAGLAGGAAKENDVGAVGQVGAAVLGGLASAGVAGGVGSLLRPAMQASEANVYQSLNNAKIDINQLPQEIRATIVDDVKKAMQTGGELKPDAIKRLVDYRTTGLTPMSSNLTLNPAEITQQRNLAKISANSKDPAAQSLANLQRENDVKLINGLNTIGANTENHVDAGNKVIAALNVKDEATKKIITNYYNQAKNATGRSAQLDHTAFTNNAADALDTHLLTGSLPDSIKTKLNDIAQGKIPLTVDVAEQLKTAMGTVQRNSNDGNVRAAIGKVREALDNTNMVDGQAPEAVAAFNKARSAHKAYMQIVEKTPALKAVRDGVEPDKFVQTYVLGNGAKSNIADVQALKNSLAGNDEAINALRGQIASYLKSKATSGNADEVANFSPKAYNDAIKLIGDEKLAMFFNKDDINMLKTIGRVSSYEKFQPTGAAVNNSNTSAAMFTALLDKVANSALVRKIPLGGSLVADPAKDVTLAIGARKALNATKALSNPIVKTKNYPLSTAYSAAMLGNDSNN